MKTRNRSSQAMSVLIMAGLLALGNQSLAADQAALRIGFARIWELAKKSAPNIRASRHEQMAAAIARDRALGHWYPRVYANARAYATNDPAAAFMGTLEQRQINSGDLSTDSLNHPPDSVYEQAAIGIELPIYEGGLRIAQAQAARKEAEAKTWGAKVVEIGSYASVVRSYAALIALEDERAQLASLRESIATFLANYRIGTRENPVGYSGLLGLKTLLNQIDGLMSENQARADGERAEIRSLIIVESGGLPETWGPEDERLQEFLRRVFPASEVDRVQPAAVRAIQLAAEASELLKDAEKARFRPRVGIFAQGDLFSGARSSAGGYSTGAYLQWDLFRASNSGAVEQAAHQSAAASARARGLEEKMNSDHQASIAAATAAEKALSLLDDSARLLEEQTKTARGLFLNGSINALQLVEVLGRRADLVEKRTKAELSLVQAKVGIFVTTAHEGVLNENAK